MGIGEGGESGDRGGWGEWGWGEWGLGRVGRVAISLYPDHFSPPLFYADIIVQVNDVSINYGGKKRSGHRETRTGSV